MKYPGGFRVFATLQLIIGLIHFIPFIILIDEIIKKNSINFQYVIISTLFISITAWSIFAAIIWFFKFKLSYVVLILTIFCNLFCIGLWDYFIMTDNPKHLVGTITVSFIYGIYVLFLIIFAFLKSVRSYNSEAENKISFKIIIVTIIIFLVIMYIPASVVALMQKFTYKYQPVSYNYISSSGDFAQFKVENVADDDLQTWWTPNIRNGLNAWIKISFYGIVEVSAVEIHPGSHYPNYAEYGDLFLLNKRLTKAKIIFDDGSSQIIDIQDKDKKQIIKLTPKNTSSITLKVLTMEKGKKWNDLCISHFMPLKRSKIFK